MSKPKFNRDDRLIILAQTCLDNDITPQKGNFSGLIRKVCLQHLGVSESGIKELTRTLTTLYRGDQWNNLLHPELNEVEGETGLKANKMEFGKDVANPLNGSAPPEEVIEINKLSVEDLAAVKKIVKEHPLDCLRNMGPSEPIKHLEHKESVQLDYLSDKDVAQILINTARKDSFNGVGRIILSDARYIMDNKQLQIDELVQFLRVHFPALDIDARSNTAQIFWDGKGAVQLIRKTATIIQPKAPIYNAQNVNEGDIHEDDEGVVPVKGD